MNLLSSASDYSANGRSTVIAIGTFDGVHLGHARVIEPAARAARQQNANSLVVTFDRHPASVFSPEKAPPMIQSFSQKVEAIEAIGVDAVLALPFTTELCRLPASEFVRMLASELAPLTDVYVGYDFTYGHRRLGNVETLKAQGEEIGFQTDVIPAFLIDDTPVSSSRVRQAIMGADFEMAQRLLGRPYVFRGVVQKGQRQGRELGFPTANMDSQGAVMPPTGVYFTELRVEDGFRPSVTNVGFRPSLRGEKPKSPVVETFVLDGATDLYGQELDLRFLQFHREEKRFEALDQLKAQIAQDVQAARSFFEVSPTR